MNQFSALAVTKTYSLTMIHIAKVADLAARLGKSQGEIVRDAIDLLYQSQEDKAAPADQQQAAEAA